MNSAAGRISVPSWTIDDSRLKSLPMMLIWSLPAPSSERNAVWAARGRQPWAKKPTTPLSAPLLLQ